MKLLALTLEGLCCPNFHKRSSGTLCLLGSALPHPGLVPLSRGGEAPALTFEEAVGPRLDPPPVPHLQLPPTLALSGFWGLLDAMSYLPSHLPCSCVPAACSPASN